MAGDVPRSAVELVDELIAGAKESGASDLHIEPTEAGLEIRRRIDGVLQPAGLLPRGSAASVVARLKVLADLLTYRTDVPQEGRIRGKLGEPEMRLSTFPTLLGEKAVLRLFAEQGRFRRLEDLGLGEDVRRMLGRLLGETSGAVVLSGPAGSGKTTTLYSCLREVVEATAGGRSLASLEDPIEAAVPGVSQSQVNPQAGFDLANGLRSLLRQDPEVIAVGEIRDRATAEVAFQAALTGHLVLTTFHAGSASGAAGRLADMDIEPYVLRSGVLAILCQRLLRRLCECARDGAGEAGKLGIGVDHYKVAAGCPDCLGTGYRGRIALAEILMPDRTPVGSAILDRLDVGEIEAAAIASGMVTLRTRAASAVEAGRTSPAEVRRVFGLAEIAGSPNPSTAG